MTINLSTIPQVLAGISRNAAIPSVPDGASMWHMSMPSPAMTRYVGTVPVAFDTLSYQVAQGALLVSDPPSGIPALNGNGGSIDASVRWFQQLGARAVTELTYARKTLRKAHNASVRAESYSAMASNFGRPGRKKGLGTTMAAIEGYTISGLIYAGMGEKFLDKASAELEKAAVKSLNADIATQAILYELHAQVVERSGKTQARQPRAAAASTWYRLASEARATGDSRVFETALYLSALNAHADGYHAQLGRVLQEYGTYVHDAGGMDASVVGKMISFATACAFSNIATDGVCLGYVASGLMAIRPLLEGRPEVSQYDAVQNALLYYARIAKADDIGPSGMFRAGTFVDGVETLANDIDLADSLAKHYLLRSSGTPPEEVEFLSDLDWTEQEKFFLKLARAVKRTIAHLNIKGWHGRSPAEGGILVGENVLSVDGSGVIWVSRDNLVRGA
jgi:hypothetical protein